MSPWPRSTSQNPAFASKTHEKMGGTRIAKIRFMQTKWIILGVGTLSCALLGGYVVGAANTASADEDTSHVAAPVQPCAVTTTPVVAVQPRVETVRPAPVVTATPRERSEGTLHIRRIEVATGMEAREPTGVADHFSASEAQLYVFLDLSNRQGDAEDVIVTFEPEHPSRTASVTGLVTLHVPANAARHRTWAWSRNVHAVGNWSAVVRDTQGRELARTGFAVE